MQNDCILVKIDEHFRPPNSYILHYHGEGSLFTLYLKGNGVKNSEFRKY